MAIPFRNGNFERPRGGTGFTGFGSGFSGGGNDNGFSGGGGRGGGYTFDPCIDPSVRSRLSEQGYLLQTVGSASPGGSGEYILNYPQSTLSTPAGSIPIFVSPSGQQYVLDCTTRTTYQLTRLDIVPPPPPPTPPPPPPPTPPNTSRYTLSLHDALPISSAAPARPRHVVAAASAVVVTKAISDRKSTRLNSSHIL